MRSIALSLLCASALAGQAATPVPATTAAQQANVPGQSAQAFVQGFYDWYIKEPEDIQYDSVGDVLKNARWPLSDELVKALTAEREPRPPSADEIDGLDFDPFLNAQDDCFPYRAGKATRAGSQYQVEVFDSNCSDPHPEVPTVIAEVEQRGGKWVFVNFIYPEAKDDLLSVLKELKANREAGNRHPN